MQWNSRESKKKGTKSSMLISLGIQAENDVNLAIICCYREPTFDSSIFVDTELPRLLMDCQTKRTKEYTLPLIPKLTRNFRFYQVKNMHKHHFIYHVSCGFFLFIGGP